MAGQANGTLGWHVEAPYDAIHVGAAAPEIPQQLLDQLKPGGRLVIPVGPEGSLQVLMVVQKQADGSCISDEVMKVMYVPLTSQEEQVQPGLACGPMRA